MDPRKKKNIEIICFCNTVSKDQIEGAILMGADSVDKIGDACTAGMGQCGGSCRPDIIHMLEHYQKTGEFLLRVKKNKGRNKPAG